MTDAALLEVYPIPLGRMLRAEWVPLMAGAVKASNLRAKTTDAGYGVWWALFLESIEQSPPGTLPVDEDELARLAGFPRDLASWRERRAEGALHDWIEVLCLPPDCDGDVEAGEVRLAHRLVLDMVNASVTWMDGAREKSRRGAQRSLASRLRRIMRDECGAHAGLTQRDDYVQAVMDRLSARGHRMTPAYVRAAMEHVSAIEAAQRGENSEALASIADRMRRRNHP